MKHLHGEKLNLLMWFTYIFKVMPFSRKYKTLKEFNREVDNLPYFGYATRIDKALKVANDDLFNVKNGMRPSVRKFLILITDGRQEVTLTEFDNPKEVYPPEIAAAPLHEKNITISAIGIGSRVDRNQLKGITRSPDEVYTFHRSIDIIQDDFINKVSGKTCEKPASGTVFQ